MKAESRRRAKSRKASVKSKLTRARHTSVDALSTRFGKVKTKQQGRDKATLGMMGMLDALPTANPFRNRLIVRSKSKSKSKRGRTRKARSLRGRRRDYVMSRRRRPTGRQSFFAPATFQY